MKIPQPTLTALLTNWPVARLATVSGDLKPHCVPIVFCEFQGLIYSPLDGKRKSGRALRRFENVAANPRAALLFDEYSTDWQALWWVRIDAQIERCEADAVLGRSLSERLLIKYPQYQSVPLLRGDPIYLRLQPVDVSGWAQSGLVETIDAAIGTVGEATRDPGSSDHSLPRASS